MDSSLVSDDVIEAAVRVVIACWYAVAVSVTYRAMWADQTRVIPLAIVVRRWFR